jgi:hypothetical protein
MTESSPVTAPQMVALVELSKGDEFLLSGQLGNLCATLCKKGLAEFRGYKKGKRVFAITDIGKARLEALR